ncbi:hypothetical protein V1264_012235 [Littorina saxatilis]|uniref:Uncharacterized protein n=2 Tax=Littorina saxatilis TaxID=31220 RepID=A0AAN9BWQ9_9CAEN
MHHQTEAMLAFMKTFSWKFFSVVTTKVVGSEDFFSALRHHERTSRMQALPNKYGHVGFEYKILSEITLDDGEDKESIKMQLREELDPDTRIILLHCASREAFNIMEVAEEIGLAGREYVWILSATAIGDKSAGEVASSSLPLGVFGVTYESSLEHMRPVVERGIKVWLKAVQNLERDGKAGQWNWDTKLSCGDRQLKKWPGGDMMFDYLRNVTLPGSAGEVATDFNEMGMVMSNKLSILNVMRKEDNLPRKSSSSSSSSSFGSRGGFGGGSKFGGGASRGSGGLPSRGTGGFPSRGSGGFPSRGSGGFPSRGSGGFPSRGSGGFPSRGAGGFPSRGGTLGGDGSSTDSDLSSRGSKFGSGGSQASTLNSGSNFNRGNSRYPSRTNSSFGRPSSLGSSSNRLSSGSSSNRLPSSQSSSLPSSSSSSSSGGSFLDRRRDSVGGFKPSRHSWRNRGGGLGSRNTLEDEEKTASVGLKPRTSRSSFFDSDTDGAAISKNDMEKSEQLTPDHHTRHQKARRHLLRHHRLSRSTPFRKSFQEVAQWDGEKLKVMQIVWPGNSSFPPKGVPETYHLKVATYIEEPHVTYKPFLASGECDVHANTCMVYERDENDNRKVGLPPVEKCCSGLSIDILDRLSKELNFNYTLFEMESGGYGSAVDHTNNTEWTGLVGAVLKEEADVAVAAMAITPEREEVIDFSVPFLETGITIVVAIREGAISPTAFLEPYDYPSWTLILVFSVHATGASIFIFEWLSPYGLDQGHTPLRVHKFSLFRSFWLIWAMLFGAAVSTDMPRGVSSRFLANIWALFAVVFLASYTANLAAFMITKEEYYDLSGIQDWRLKNPHHRHPPFKYATMPDGATETNIRKNHPDLYVHMKKYPQLTVKEAVKNLKDQKIQAFIYDATTLEYAVGKDVGCKLKSVGKRYAETGYGVGFPKKSRWIKKFNEVLLRMQDSGDIERLQKFWLAGACHKKSQQRGSSSHTLGILNFTSAFILLGGGVVLGTLLLMLEHIYFRFGRKSLRKWDKCGCCSLVSLSMGQSLTFEQSVMEAIDMHRHHKCRDPLCETQLWKAKHELDIAMLKIDQLKRQLAKQTAEDGGAGASKPVWTYDPEATLQKDGVPRKRAVLSAPIPVNSRGSKDPLLNNSHRNGGVEPISGTTIPPRPPAEDRSYDPVPASSQNDSQGPPEARSSLPRRTRVSDGKIYENVDGGIDIESSI